MPTDHDRERGRIIRAARSRRWRKRQDFADYLDMGKSTLSAVELGSRAVSPETIATIEAGLGWLPGEADRRAKGLRPRERYDPELSEVIALWPRLSARTRRMVLEVARQGAE